MATLLSRCAWPWLLGGLAAGTLYLYYIVGAQPARPFPDAAQTAFGRAAGVLRGIHAAAQLILAGCICGQAGALFPETSGLHWVGLGVLALAAFAARKGTAVVLRCGAVLFVPIALILGAVPLLALHGARWAWALPAGAPSDFGAGLLFALLPLSLGWLRPQLHESDAAPGRWLPGLCLAPAAFAGICSACISPALARQPMSVLRLARSVTVFGVMLRLESFVSCALMASAFTGVGLLLCSALAAGRKTEIRSSDVLYFSLATAVVSMLPDRVVLPLGTAAATFCALYSILTTTSGGKRRISKKLDFFEKKA